MSLKKMLLMVNFCFKAAMLKRNACNSMTINIWWQIAWLLHSCQTQITNEGVTSLDNKSFQIRGGFFFLFSNLGTISYHLNDKYLFLGLELGQQSGRGAAKRWISYSKLTMLTIKVINIKKSTTTMKSDIGFVCQYVTTERTKCDLQE